MACVPLWFKIELEMGREGCPEELSIFMPIESCVALLCGPQLRAVFCYGSINWKLYLESCAVICYGSINQ